MVTARPCPSRSIPTSRTTHPTWAKPGRFLTERAVIEGGWRTWEWRHRMSWRWIILPFVSLSSLTNPPPWKGGVRGGSNPRHTCRCRMNAQRRVAPTTRRRTANCASAHETSDVLAQPRCIFPVNLVGEPPARLVRCPSLAWSSTYRYPPPNDRFHCADATRIFQKNLEKLQILCDLSAGFPGISDGDTTETPSTPFKGGLKS